MDVDGWLDNHLAVVCRHHPPCARGPGVAATRAVGVKDKGFLSEVER